MKQKAAGSITTGDGLDIPPFLRRSKDEPRLETNGHALQSVAIVRRKPFEVPMGMTEEEYEIARAKYGERPARVEQPAKAAAIEEPVKKSPAPPKKKKGPAPSGTFKLVEWARKAGHDPRAVRRAARANKAAIAKLQVNGLKYVFKDASKDAIAKIIIDGMANESKRKVNVTKAPVDIAPSGRRKRIIPPPEQTVWSSSAKKHKPGPAPKTVSPKEDARRVAKKAVKEFGKRNITKVPAK